LTARHLSAGLLAIYWAGIFIGTHLPGRVVPGIDVQDYVLHFGAFVGLSFLLAWTLAALRPTRKMVLSTALIIVAYATMDELTQSLIPGRATELSDRVADVSGGIVGLAAYGVSFVMLSVGVRCQGSGVRE
jgi:VanZ family protein